MKKIQDFLNNIVVLFNNMPKAWRASFYALVGQSVNLLVDHLQTVQLVEGGNLTGAIAGFASAILLWLANQYLTTTK